MTPGTSGAAGQGEQDSSLKSQASRAKRALMYLMHPLGAGPDRERNRQLACHWQAAVQADHPEWLVIAPWIALSGAWSEDRRDEGMAVDYATIDLCEGGIVAGPKDGPKNHQGVDLRWFSGVSPGMALELAYFAKEWPSKVVLDVRDRYSIALPVPERRHEMAPLYAVGDKVLLENKQGEHEVLGVEKTGYGNFRYRLVSKVEFFAYENAIGGKAR